MKQEIKNQDEHVRLVRILAKDISGNRKVYSGLTAIKGVSWMYSNAICNKLGIDRTKKIEDLSQEEIRKIEEFLISQDETFFNFMKNRQKDVDSGKDKHLAGADIDLQKEFDIKSMKKIKSYRGIRHQFGHPVRGQRTKANFRKNRSKSGGIKKK